MPSPVYRIGAVLSWANGEFRCRRSGSLHVIPSFVFATAPRYLTPHTSPLTHACPHFCYRRVHATCLLTDRLIVGGTTYRGSLLASFNTLPRKSLESTYFESNASVAVAVPSASGGGGDGGAVVGGGADEPLSTAGGDAGAGRTPAAAGGQEEGAVEAAEKEEEEEQGPKKGGKSGGGGGSRGGGGMAQEPGEDMVVGHAVDPAALVRPPRVGDGKLEHDKERRLGVANDLEAVIAVRVGGWRSMRLSITRRGIRRSISNFLLLGFFT